MIEINEKAGLSPRVRGSLMTVNNGIFHLGSIPARAGEPVVRGAPFEIAWVYPRACGGASGSRLAISRETGLSPRVRGSLV